MTTDRTLRRFALLAASLVAALLLVAPAASAAVPAGFPAQVQLPKQIVPVFLVSQEFVVDRGGQEHLRAHVYELNQRVRDGRTVRRHFQRLFHRLGWAGSFQEGGAVGEHTGTFSHDAVQVQIRIRSDDQSHRQLIELAVRVFKA